MQVSKLPAAESKTTELFPPNTVQIFPSIFYYPFSLHYILYICVCARACARACVHVRVCMPARLRTCGSSRGQRTTCGSQFSSHPVGSRDRTQVSRPGGKRLSPVASFHWPRYFLNARAELILNRSGPGSINRLLHVRPLSLPPHPSGYPSKFTKSQRRS